MTITLHGFAISNYYNKVKMTLLEKGVPFEERHVGAGSTDAVVRAASPLGKIPFVTTPQGALCESQAIAEWIEATHPSPALLPADAFAAAKVRELCTFIDWHLEMTARQLYASAFFGAPALSEGNLARIRKQLEADVRAVRQLARFEPYIAGDTFTQADISAFNSLPVVGMASKASFGEDLLITGGVDYKAYLQVIGQRPSAQKVVEDRKAASAKPR